jgi:hypothetical protein
VNRDSVTERVSAGIDLLDRECRGWDKHIDLGRLSLDSCQRCVLGQLFRSYSLGLADLELDDDEAVELGFDQDEDEDDGDGTGYPALTAAWTIAIRARREVTE